MTSPTTRRGIWSSGVLLRPLKVAATDSRIDWADVEPFGDDWPGTESLLTDFVDLAAADPEGMAAFVSRYGVLELCRHGRPVWHANEGPIDHLAVRHIRRAARAFEAWQTAGRRLKAANQASQSHDVQLFLDGGFWAGGYGRQELAEELTQLYRDTGIRPLVRWEPSRMLTVTTEGAGLLGVLSTLLLRAIASRDEVSYRCDICGDLVERGRPPRPDEAIYCDRAECKREQRRRNTAAYRARKKG